MLNQKNYIPGKPMWLSPMDLPAIFFLKTSEAVGRLMTDIIKEDIRSNFTTKIGGILVKPAFYRIKKNDGSFGSWRRQAV